LFAFEIDLAQAALDVDVIGDNVSGDENLQSLAADVADKMNVSLALGSATFSDINDLRGMLLPDRRQRPLLAVPCLYHVVDRQFCRITAP
jgi:hypothetical protein